MHYTDFVGNPIHEGDEIVYAQSAYGGGAQLHRAIIKKIIPLIPHREYTGYMREDQATQARATQFRGKQYDDPTKRFVIQIERAGYNKVVKKYTIPHSNHIIKVIH